MAPITYEAMAQQALIRVDDVTNTYPSTRRPMYRRISMRQRQLFVRAAQLNPDYYGTNITVALAAGVADLSAIAPELIQRLEVDNAGTSGYASGREIAMVTLTDPDGELAPRATLRSYRLSQVGTDLANVTSVRLWYSLLPAAAAATETGLTALSLDQPWDGILEADLAAWVVGKATALPTDVRASAVAMFMSEAAQLEAQFDAHLRAVAPTVQRFYSPLARRGPLL